MYRSSEHTMFQSLGDPSGWTVYAVRTAGSVYHVGLPSSARNGRRVVALRGYSKQLGRMIDVQDSNPRIGGKSLFDVPVEHWPGFCLEVGTLTTSPVVSVTLETDADHIGSVTAILQMRAPEAARMKIAEPAPEAAPVARAVAVPRVAVVPPQPPQPERPPPSTVLYPESVLVTLERAGRHLASVAGVGDFAQALAAQPELCARTLEVLESCARSIARIRADMARR